MLLMLLMLLLWSWLLFDIELLSFLRVCGFFFSSWEMEGWRGAAPWRMFFGARPGGRGRWGVGRRRRGGEREKEKEKERLQEAGGGWTMNRVPGRAQ